VRSVHLCKNFSHRRMNRRYCISKRGSSGAEEKFIFSQTCAQLLRRVLKLGRRTMRCPLSPRSLVAPTVRPTLVFLSRRFIRSYTKVWVLPIITVGSRPLLPTLIISTRRHLRPYAAVSIAAGDSSAYARVLLPPPTLRVRRRPPAPLL
jgi:hypothetical protein